MNKRISILSLEHPLEGAFARFLLIALCVLVVAYMYFVCASVLNIMARKEASTRLVQVQGAIGTLEQEYFALSEGLTESTGETLGLAPVADTSYVYRPGNAAVVSEADTIQRNAI